MSHGHRATPNTVASVYQHCRCGAIRHRDRDGRFDEWHVCKLCRIDISDDARHEAMMAEQAEEYL